MELALRLGYSPRHISFVEVGRARPSRHSSSDGWPRLELNRQCAVPLSTMPVSRWEAAIGCRTETLLRASHRG